MLSFSLVKARAMRAAQRQEVLSLVALGWSYRQIAAETGLHWTRVGQIVRGE